MCCGPDSVRSGETRSRGRSGRDTRRWAGRSTASAAARPSGRRSTPSRRATTGGRRAADSRRASGRTPAGCRAGTNAASARPSAARWCRWCRRSAPGRKDGWRPRRRRGVPPPAWPPTRPRRALPRRRRRRRARGPAAGRGSAPDSAATADRRTPPGPANRRAGIRGRRPRTGTTAARRSHPSGTRPCARRRSPAAAAGSLRSGRRDAHRARRARSPGDRRRGPGPRTCRRRGLRTRLPSTARSGRGRGPSVDSRRRRC